MPFGMMSGVGQGMGVLDGGGDCWRRWGSFGVNVGHPITSGDFVAYLFPAMRGGDTALPKLLWHFLFLVVACNELSLKAMTYWVSRGMLLILLSLSFTPACLSLQKIVKSNQSVKLWKCFHGWIISKWGWLLIYVPLDTTSLLAGLRSVQI